MNKFIVVLGFLVFGISSCNAPENGSNETKAVAEKSKTFTNVSVSDLEESVQNDPNIIVLDVRTTGEVSDGYIPDAIHADIQGNTFESKVRDLDKKTTVYVYCRSGHRSQIASKKLISLGFQDVRNVEGGFLAWEQAGFEIAK